MKYMRTSLAVFVAAATSIALGSAAFAQGDRPLNATTTISRASLGAQSGLLPSNPFYFAKEWRRDFRKFLTFDAVKRSAADLQTASEKMAELKGLAETNLGTPERVDAVLYEYKNLMDQIAGRIGSVGGDENGNRFLADGIRKIVLHEQLIRELVAERTPALRDTLASLQNTEEVILTRALRSPETARSALEDAMRAQTGIALREIIVFRLVDRTEDAVRAALNESSFELLVGAKNAAARALEAAFTAKKVSSDEVRASAQLLLDAPAESADALAGLRERIGDATLRTALGAARDALLKAPTWDGNAMKEQAERSIRGAAAYIDDVKKLALARMGDFPAAQALFEKAVFNLEQATAALMNGNILVAIDQAGAARAAAQMAWETVSQTVNTIRAQIEQLKRGYDTVATGARDVATGSADIRDALTSLEREIVSLSARTVTAAQERILNPIRDAFLRLETVRQAIGQ